MPAERWNAAYLGSRPVQVLSTAAESRLSRLVAARLITPAQEHRRLSRLSSRILQRWPVRPRARRLAWAQLRLADLFEVSHHGLLNWWL